MQKPTDHLLAGAARRVINPPAGIAHAGWGAQTHERAEGLDLDLWTTALAVSDGRTTGVIVDIDTLLFSGKKATALLDAVAAATGLPLDHIRCSYSHSHSTPVTDKTWIEQGADLVEPWLDAVIAMTAAAAAEALTRLEPVVLRSGAGQAPINISRRGATPDGRRICGKSRDDVVDPAVLVLKLNRLDGSTLATLFNYGCHPTIMGPGNRLITPDFPGAARRVVEAATGGFSLFLQGAAGDQGPAQTFVADAAIYRGLGAILGHEVAKVALSLDYVPADETLREVVESGAPLGMYDDRFPDVTALPLEIVRKRIAVPLRDDLPSVDDARAALEALQRDVEQARARGDEAALKAAGYRARRADIRLRMAESLLGATELFVEAQFFRLGDVVLVSCNFEPFARTGIAIKQASPFPVTLFSGYSNNEMAYMPTAEARAEGGYEVETTPFGGEAEAVFRAAVIATLSELWERRSTLQRSHS